MGLTPAHEEILRGSHLFAGIAPATYSPLLQSLQARTIRVESGEPLLLAGEPPRFMGLMLSGHAHIHRESVTGDLALIATLEKGELFAETLCLAGLPASPMTVVAHGVCEYLRLPMAGLFPWGFGFGPKYVEQTVRGQFPPESPIPAYQSRLRTNLLRIMAQKNLYLQSRMDILSARSIREKVLRFLEPYAKAGSSFTVPLNREQMAAYLCVDRSALSHELMRMEADGLLTYKKNRFTLLSGGKSKE